MKCPKCQYISFDSGDRCRNCGYDFSLARSTLPQRTICRFRTAPSRSALSLISP